MDRRFLVKSDLGAFRNGNLMATKMGSNLVLNTNFAW